MNKLLGAYAINPTLKNAKKLRDYERSHPFAACLLTKDAADLLYEAICYANKAEDIYE